MFFPLKIGSSIDCGSKKSLPHPSVGQIATFSFGVAQNFDVTVACGTSRRFILNPIFETWFCHDSAVCFAGAWLSATTSSGGPWYMPSLKPAFFRYDFARFTSPDGFL